LDVALGFACNGMIRREPTAKGSRTPKGCDAKSPLKVSEFKIRLAGPPKWR